MGILASLNLSISDNQQRWGQMLKDATAQKKAGDLPRAIETLRKAYREIATSNLEYSVETFLRLAMYLQAAGRSDEAWAEFNKIITGGYPIPALYRPEVGPMILGHVYDKMRLFLQREGRNVEAVRQGVLSDTFVALGLFRQKRKEEYEDYTSSEEVQMRLRPLMKKAKRTDHLASVVSVLCKHYAQRKTLEPTAVLREVDSVLKEPDRIF